VSFKKTASWQAAFLLGTSTLGGLIMANRRTVILVEAAVSVALAYLLGFLKLWQMPFGGSVSLEMVPLFVFAFRRGPAAGMTAGVIYGLLNLMVDGLQWIVHPVQLVLDYPLPFLLVGTAGFFKARPLMGVFLGSLARFVSHFISGYVFFGSYGLEYGLGPGVYSLVYNGAYILPELLISLAVFAILPRYLLDAEFYSGKEG